MEQQLALEIDRRLRLIISRAVSRDEMFRGRWKFVRCGYWGGSDSGTFGL